MLTGELGMNLAGGGQRARAGGHRRRTQQAGRAPRAADVRVRAATAARAGPGAPHLPARPGALPTHHNPRSYGLSKADNQVAGGVLLRTGDRAATAATPRSPPTICCWRCSTRRQAWPAGCWRRRAIRRPQCAPLPTSASPRLPRMEGAQRQPAGVAGAARHARGCVHRGRDAQGRVRGRRASAAGAGQAAPSSTAAPS